MECQALHFLTPKPAEYYADDFKQSLVEAQRPLCDEHIQRTLPRWHGTFHHHFSVKYTEQSPSELGNLGRELQHIENVSSPCKSPFCYWVACKQQTVQALSCAVAKRCVCNSLGSPVLCWVPFQHCCSGKMPSAEQHSMGPTQASGAGRGEAGGK